MIAIDRPGFGYSDFGKAVDLETQASLLESLATQITNSKPIVLVGHSLGGPVIVNGRRQAEFLCASGSACRFGGSAHGNTRNLAYGFKAKPIRYLIRVRCGL
jgi:predicted alpha/beta hydrolase